MDARPPIHTLPSPPSRAGASRAPSGADGRPQPGPLAARARRRPLVAGRLALAALAAAALQVSAPRALGAPPPEDARPPSGLESLEARWNRLDTRTKDRIREVFRGIRELSPQQQQRLFDLLRARPEEERREIIRQARKTVEEPSVDRVAVLERQRLLREQLARLPRKDRERIEALPREQRAAALRRTVQETRRRMIESLPPSLREQALRMSPKEQVVLLRTHQAEQAAMRTFGDLEEVELLRSMPRAKVVKAMLPLERSGPPGPPPRFLSAETWRRWRKLQPFERPRVLRHILGPPAARPPDPGLRPPARPAAKTQGPGLRPPARPAAKTQGPGLRP
ncbi:MAG: hypothetical protein JXA90_01735, partial [Planctomycetes bacterium]|nr:hypothetical protein [Planctomycetota bacterium]